jgi:hypothetical protein
MSLPTVSALRAHTRASFVRHAVKETAVTTAIINAILPYFPKACICIAGHLDNGDQYWKVNYHWDLLVSKIDQFLALASVAENLKACARAIRLKLMTNQPVPVTGYRNDKAVGATKDSSPPQKIQARHGILKQSKKDFEAVLVKAGIVDAATKLNPSAAAKPWWLAVAPVAVPGDSKHGTGYALDISGNNTETTRISNALGATLVFNEASHVHVEWAGGVKLPR